MLKHTLEQDFSFTNARISDTIIDAFVKEVISYEDHFVWRLILCEGDVSCLVEGTAREPRARLRESKTPSQADSDTGSTEDVSQFRFVLEKAAEYGYKDAGFILDRGLFSDLSIEYMDAKGYEFVIVANGCKELVRDRVLEVCGSFENKKENAIPFYDVSGITIMDRAFPKDEKKRYVHIYYSDYRNATERTKLQTAIREQKEYLESLRGSEVNVDGRYETYFDLVYHVESPGKRVLKLVEEKRYVISRDIKLCGYFGIITSAEMTAAEAIALYRNRDGTERLFRGDKVYLGGKCETTYYDEPTHSKVFVEFVALIMRNRIYSCLMKRMKEIRKKRIYMTVPAAIRELDKIELTRQPGGVYRLDYAVTATQKDILQAFGLTAVSVKKEADELGGQLGSVTS